MGFDITGLGSLFDFGSKIIDKIFPDANAAAAAKQELLKMQMSGDLQQMASQSAINLEEAKSTNWFVAGWRPYVGWGCGTAFLYAAIVEPVARFTATVLFHYTGAFPVIDTSLTMQVLLGMLGLGVMRSYEKKQNVVDKH